MFIFSEITEKQCIKDRYPALNSENSNCSWVLIIFTPTWCS